MHSPLFSAPISGYYFHSPDPYIHSFPKPHSMLLTLLLFLILILYNMFRYLLLQISKVEHHCYSMHIAANSHFSSQIHLKYLSFFPSVLPRSYNIRFRHIPLQISVPKYFSDYLIQHWRNYLMILLIL